MAIKQIWFVYKTTNLLNGHYYVGVHRGTESDTYLGSGLRIKAAVQKYGRASFQREIIEVCDSAEDAYALESLIVNEEFLTRDDVYNLALGGKGSNVHPLNEETRQRMRKPKSKEHCMAISESKLGRPTSDNHKRAVSLGRMGSTHSEETRAKMSKTRKGVVHVLITCPHCGKTGGAPAMKQWHFNNCRA